MFMLCAMNIPANLSPAELLAFVIEWLMNALAAWKAAQMAGEIQPGVVESDAAQVVGGESARALGVPAAGVVSAIRRRAAKRAAAGAAGGGLAEAPARGERTGGRGGLATAKAARGDRTIRCARDDSARFSLPHADAGAGASLSFRCRI
jgi:hypothetical protein